MSRGIPLSFTGLHTGDEAVVALHVLCHLGGTHGDCCVKIGEGYDEDEVGDVVGPAVDVGECLEESVRGISCSPEPGKGDVGSAKLQNLSPDAALYFGFFLVDYVQTSFAAHDFAVGSALLIDALTFILF